MGWLKPPPSSEVTKIIPMMLIFLLHQTRVFGSKKHPPGAFQARFPRTDPNLPRSPLEEYINDTPQKLGFFFHSLTVDGQKSGSPVEVGRFIPLFYKGFSTIQTVVGRRNF